VLVGSRWSPPKSAKPVGADDVNRLADLAGPLTRRSTGDPEEYWSVDSTLLAVLGPS